MPDPVGLQPETAQRLLEGVDTAFEQVLHGRYGGGIECIVMDGNERQSPQVLRVSRADPSDCIQLFLQHPGDTAAPAMGHGLVAGVVTLATGTQSIADVTIVTEIVDLRDANEAADATPNATGLLFAAEREGGLSVVRSTEAAGSSGRDARRQQRGFVPRQQRTTPGRTLGLATNGHRRALMAALAVPVSMDLLTRLGLAVARLGASEGAASIGRLILVVQSAPETVV